MKKNLIFALSLLLSSVATLNLTSCQDDDDDDENHRPAVESKRFNTVKDTVSTKTVNYKDAAIKKSGSSSKSHARVRNQHDAEKSTTTLGTSSKSASVSKDSVNHSHHRGVVNNLGHRTK